MGGRCNLHSLESPEGSKDTCENCGGGGPPEEWAAAVGPQKQVCRPCAEWYLKRAPTSCCWKSDKNRGELARDRIRHILNGIGTGSTERLVSMISNTLIKDKKMSPITHRWSHVFPWGHLRPMLMAAAQSVDGYKIHQQQDPDPIEIRPEYDERYYEESFWKDDTAWWRQHTLEKARTAPQKQTDLLYNWPESKITRRGLKLCFVPRNVTKVEEVEVDSDVQSVPGGELDDEEEKQCILDCPYPVREDFHRNRVEGRRELFICHACHKGVHLECLERTRTIDRQEREDTLDSEVNRRCADCVSSDRFRPSAILEEFSQIHGKERMLLIRWSGYEMAEDSLTHKNHLETDYTGLQAQLTRRRTERSRRRQDRYGKSVLACKYALMGVKKIRRLDTLGLDRIQGRWKKGTEDDQTYHEWRMTHPGTRRALDVPHQKDGNQWLTWL